MNIFNLRRVDLPIINKEEKTELQKEKTIRSESNEKLKSIFNQFIALPGRAGSLATKAQKFIGSKLSLFRSHPKSTEEASGSKKPTGTEYVAFDDLQLLEIKYQAEKTQDVAFQDLSFGALPPLDVSKMKEEQTQVYNSLVKYFNKKRFELIESRNQLRSEYDEVKAKIKEINGEIQLLDSKETDSIECLDSMEKLLVALIDQTKLSEVIERKMNTSTNSLKDFKDLLDSFKSFNQKLLVAYDKNESESYQAAKDEIDGFFLKMNGYLSRLGEPASEIANIDVSVVESLVDLKKIREGLDNAITALSPSKLGISRLIHPSTKENSQRVSMNLSQLTSTDGSDVSKMGGDQFQIQKATLDYFSKKKAEYEGMVTYLKSQHEAVEKQIKQNEQDLERLRKQVKPERYNSEPDGLSIEKLSELNDKEFNDLVNDVTLLPQLYFVLNENEKRLEEIENQIKDLTASVKYLKDTTESLKNLNNKLSVLYEKKDNESYSAVQDEANRFFQQMNEYANHLEKNGGSNGSRIEEKVKLEELKTGMEDLLENLATWHANHASSNTAAISPNNPPSVSSDRKPNIIKRVLEALRSKTKPSSTDLQKTSSTSRTIAQSVLPKIKLGLNQESVDLLLMDATLREQFLSGVCVLFQSITEPEKIILKKFLTYVIDQYSIRNDEEKKIILTMVDQLVDAKVLKGRDSNQLDENNYSNGLKKITLDLTGRYKTESPENKKMILKIVGQLLEIITLNGQILEDTEQQLIRNFFNEMMSIYPTRSSEEKEIILKMVVPLLDAKVLNQTDFESGQVKKNIENVLRLYPSLSESLKSVSIKMLSQLIDANVLNNNNLSENEFNTIVVDLGANYKNYNQSERIMILKMVNKLVRNGFWKKENFNEPEVLPETSDKSYENRLKVKGFFEKLISGDSIQNEKEKEIILELANELVRARFLNLKDLDPLKDAVVKKSQGGFIEQRIGKCKLINKLAENKKLTEKLVDDFANDLINLEHRLFYKLSFDQKILPPSAKENLWSEELKDLNHFYGDIDFLIENNFKEIDLTDVNAKEMVEKYAVLLVKLEKKFIEKGEFKLAMAIFNGIGKLKHSIKENLFKDYCNEKQIEDIQNEKERLRKDGSYTAFLNDLANQSLFKNAFKFLDKVEKQSIYNPQLIEKMKLERMRQNKYVFPSAEKLDNAAVQIISGTNTETIKGVEVIVASAFVYNEDQTIDPKPFMKLHEFLAPFRQEKRKTSTHYNLFGGK